MSSTPELASAEAWLQWFEDVKYVQCRAYLCTAYRLEALDADALINTARLQVFLHWETIQDALAYFWRILRREVGKYFGNLKKESARQDAYVAHWRLNVKVQERTQHCVTDILERATPPQRNLLQWFLHGDDDTFVANRLGTTAHAVRQARYMTYTTLRKQIAQ